MKTIEEKKAECLHTAIRIERWLGKIKDRKERTNFIREKMFEYIKWLKENNE